MKLLTVPNYSSVFVYKEPVSMARGFPSLMELSKKISTHEDDLFVFYNKKHTYVKVLFYNKKSMTMIVKKLPKGTFAIPDNGSVTLQAIEKMLEHVVIAKPKTVTITEHRATEHRATEHARTEKTKQPRKYKKAA